MPRPHDDDDDDDDDDRPGRGQNHRDDIRTGDTVYLTSPELDRTYKTDTYVVTRVKSNQAPYWALRSTRTGILAIIDSPVVFNVVNPT